LPARPTRPLLRSLAISSTSSTASPRLALPEINVPRPTVGLGGRLRAVPFILLHVGAVAAAVAVAPTWTAIGLCFALYVIRMFGITGVYHRYFAHRAYRTSRWFQFVLAWIGCSAMQKGPLWWASHHRHHHKYSDQEDDPHSPIIKTFWWAHVGWVISGRFRHAPLDSIRDYTKYPELRWLDRFNWVPGFALAGLCYLVAGLPGLVWGFLVSTVLLYHGTFLVNSACHVWGTRRYATTDQSKNNWWAAILTLGEGWHNNHHHYQSCARQGFKWWEIDVSYYTIRTLAAVGLVWDVREPTERALKSKLISDQQPERG
jgi:stearoyl-CoA desaturase (delta-9 desaturase)